MGFWKDLLHNYNELLKKNNDLKENREVSLLFLRFITFLFNFTFLAIILNINIFIVTPICYFINWFIWDLSTTWFVVDFIQGLIIYKEENYIKKKLYIKIVTLIDLYIWLKNKIREKKRGKKIKLKKITKEHIILFTLNLIKILYKLYIYIIKTLYLLFGKKKPELNYFWEKINFNKNYLIEEQKIKQLLYNKINLNLNLLIKNYDILWKKEHSIKREFLKNNNIKINLLWNKINIIMYFVKYFLMQINLIIIDLKNTPHLLYIYIKLVLLYICIYTKYIYNYIFNINTYIYIYKLYIYYYNNFNFIIHYIYYINIYNNIFKYIIYKKKLLYIYNNYFKENYINLYYIILNDNINKKIKLIYKTNKFNELSMLIHSKEYIYNILINNLNELNNNKYNYIDKQITLIYYLLNFINNKINYFKNLNWKKIWLEILIFYVNKKRPWKQFKYDKSIYIIKYLDGLEYAMLTHKKYYQSKNIEKFHKKKYIVKKIPSIIEKELKIIKNNLNKNKIIVYEKIKYYIKCIKLLHKIIKIKHKNIKIKHNMLFTDYIKFITNTITKKIIPIYLNLLIQNYENIITINIYKLYNIYIYNIILKENKKQLNFDKIQNINNNISIIIKNINVNTIIIINKLYNIYMHNINEQYAIIYIKYINENYRNLYMYIYTPFLMINYIMSDICLSITFLKKKYKKKINKNKKKIFNKWIIFKVKYRKFNNFYKKIKNIIVLLFNKTIYITFLCAYFFNSHATNYIYTNVMFNYKYIKPYINNIILYIIINKNILYVLITIIGLTLTIKWSRGVHRFFGNYLWTMTIFPIFLESHKILYLKLITINLFNYKKIENLIFIKLNLIDLFNFKFYNLYNFSYILILITFLLYAVKHGAFRTVYANLSAARWKFIKYPTIIIIVELFRYKIIELFSILILYINLNNKLQNTILNIYIYINDLKLIKIIYYLINRFLFITEEFPFYILYSINVPNLFLINFFIDLLLAYISLNWLLKYLNTFVKSDKKYVAFPLVTCEIILKYILYFYITYYLYFLLYSISTNPNGKIFEYIAIILTWTYIYLEIRVHKIPRKTMPWYFRQIVELWPSTAINIWTTSKALYNDQQKYLSMRKKFKNYRKIYKDNYDKSELWEKKIILAYQRDKEYYLHLFTAFCKLMSRKEKMLKEVNIFDYHGWQQEWTYNYKKINIYTWKVDWWDKPYLYIFKKNIAFTNVRDFYFAYFFILYRFSCKFNWMVMIFWISKPLEYYYVNYYLHIYNNDDLLCDEDEIEDEYSNLKHGIFYRGRKYKNLCKNWKNDLKKKGEDLENLKKLKRLKRVLMEFSSGKRIKTPDWVFPMDYEKQYKKDGWKMFENPEIDKVELDWRPKFSEW